MLLNRISVATAGGCVLALLLSSGLRADDWRVRNYDVPGGGMMTMEYPEYWGKKPKFEVFEDVTEIQFGPYGPKSKPFFFVHMVSAIASDPIGADDLLKITEEEIGKFRNVAMETDIAVNTLQGAANTAHYFSITDRQSRWGEYDYMTMAVIASGNLLTRCSFLSSDGAPDFGADAIRMIESVAYVAPAAEHEDK